MTPTNLFEAIEHADLSALERLLAAGADPDEADVHAYQATPLSYACDRGETGAVRILLSAGADPNVSAYAPPLVAAATHGFAELVEILLKAGASVNDADETGTGALWIAAANGFADIARCLVEAGANREQADHDGQSPADVALENGHAALANYLADPTRYPATHAFWRSSKKNARKAAQARRDAVQKEAAGGAPAEPEWTFSGGIARSPWATQDFPSIASQGNLKLARAMLDAGLDPDWTQFKGHATALMQAARAGELAMVELLLTRGARPGHRTEKGLTALHMALFKPSARLHTPVVERLLAAGADPNAADQEGQRPLHMALSHAIPDIVKALIAAGGDPFLRDRAGRAPADWAPTRGKHAATIQALLEEARASR
ncbi:ankyrin repeat domain-containing protein [Hyalangium gracile]|uniref:ankyrin repeat domain-containing protein n=1 Tax=Hyalangium gracile TaxID=394092 RepID=UPI001CCFDD03|nr:ankyrin repeat domain-containing protein [Hyalangium gracile]